MSLDIILVAFVAVFIFLRLRSELGKKTGNEPQPPLAGQHSRHKLHDDLQAEAEDRTSQADIIDMEEDPVLRGTYADIRKLDRSFNVAQFIDGAKSAYGMILEAFWAGDKDTLANFLDDAVIAKFGTAIAAREAGELTIENQLLDVTDASVISAELVSGRAEITVHFTSEVVAVTRNKDGKIVEGNASDAVDMNDKWTFSRDVKSRDPSWTLIATSAG